MKISIFGLGYVGCVSAACLAKEGHKVVGVDVNATKVDIINSGQSPIVEKDLDKILAQVVNNNDDSAGSLTATTDAARAIQETDVSLVCVGTPSNANGSLKLDYVRRCAQEIGAGLKGKSTYHVVVGRSTMLPGSVEDAITREVEYASGKKAGRDFGTAINPEFLREGTAIHDFYNPPVTVIGEDGPRAGDALAEMYAFLDAPLKRTDIRSAEMVKYACNAFHAVKVAFANEIGSICKPLGIDGHTVMDIFCMDRKLNLSEYYLKPGFAFGGSCLPKDLRAIGYKAKSLDVEAPLLQSVLVTNQVHIQRVINDIVAKGKKRVGLLGLSFKAGTDDLRESPIVNVAEALIGKGYDLRIYDRNVSIAALFGSNKEYIEHEIPHISSLMSDSLEEVVEQSDIIVIGNKSEEFNEIAKRPFTDKVVYDLVRVDGDLSTMTSSYEGVGW